MDIIKDKIKTKGVIELHQSTDGVNFQKIKEFNNLFTDVGFKNFLDLLVNDPVGYNISHFAVGSGSSIADRTDTVVEGHIQTLPITSSVYSMDGLDHVLTNTLNLNSAQGNGTIRKVALIGFGPTTVLGGNYDPTDPDLLGAEWKMINYADVLLPNGKIKTTELILKFIWRQIFS